MLNKKGRRDIRKIRDGRTLLRVTDIYTGTHPVRILTADGAMQSALYLEDRLQNRPVFPYMRSFEWAFRLDPEIRGTLLLGGGGFSYPRTYLAKHPLSSIDVCEPSGKMLELARSCFGLTELEKTYADRLRVIQKDGCSFLSETDRSYQLIINDAFSGRSPDRDLCSDEGIRLVKAHLAKDGIYLINLATALRGPLSSKGRRVMRLLRKHFEYTLLLPVHEEKHVLAPQNCLLFASAREFRYFQS